MGNIKDVYDIAVDLVSRLKKKTPVKPEEQVSASAQAQSALPDRGSHGITWEQYDNLYDIEGYRVAYLPILNHWKGQIRFLFFKDVTVSWIDEKFKLGHEFGDIIPTPVDAYDGRCCRLSDYTIGSTGNLSLYFQETSYFDYFRSGEQLDAPSLQIQR